MDNSYKVCLGCSYHYPLTAGERIWIMTDENSFSEFNKGLKTSDPLLSPVMRKGWQSKDTGA